MTQWTNGIDFPPEPMLLVRPCLIDICVRVRPAAKMLSALLYHARSCTDDTFHLHRSQSQIVADTTDEVCEKTLCDVATPILKILGFIEADANSRIIHYIVHMDKVRAAVLAYRQGKDSLITLLRQFVKTTLETVLKTPTLETVLKSIETVLKSVPQHKNQFQSSLETVLMIFRASSKDKRGRKPKPEVQPEAQNEEVEIDRDYVEKDTGDSKRDISLTYVSDGTPFRSYAEGLSEQSFKTSLEELEAIATRLLTVAVSDLGGLSTSSTVVENNSHSQIRIASPYTTRAESTAIGETNGSADTYHHRDNRDHHPGADTFFPVHPGSTLPLDTSHAGYPEDAQRQITAETPGDAQPATRQERTTRPPAKETKQAGKRKKGDEVPAKCDAAEVRRRINEHRGYALEETVEIIRENKAIKTWSHLHTLDEFDPVMTYLQERDPYWSKPENKYRIGGITFLKETPRVLSEIAKSTKHPDVSRKVSANGMYKNKMAEIAAQQRFYAQGM